MDTTTEKAPRTRTPKSFDDILRGAKALPLEERVKIRDAMTGSIAAELGDLKAAAANAEKLVNGG